MPTVSDEELAVARVYSDAMLKLAEAKGEVDLLLEELLDLSAYLEKNPEFGKFLTSPMVDPDKRRVTLKRLFRGRASDLLVDSLQILNRKDRLGLLRGVAEAYRLSCQELRGRIDVHVRTAIPLTDKDRARLGEIIKKRVGKEAVLVETVDDELIGGMVVVIGDEKLDVSVGRQLEKLGAAFRERASHEIHSGERSYVV